MEDAPAPNALNKFDVFEKNGAVYIRGTEADIKAGQRNPVIKCSVSQPEERVVIVGGYVWALFLHHLITYSNTQPVEAAPWGSCRPCAN